MRWPPPPDWPHADVSRQVYCRPHRWHLQEMGSGNTLLLLHGAGGSTHSFRALMPLLATDHHVVALDLPGQGCTQLGARHRSGLEATAEDIVALATQEGWHPTAIIGHSAGGALALQLSQTLLSPRGQPPKIIGINAALDSFKGLAGVLFPVLAKFLASVPFTARIFAQSTGTPGRVESLIASTGSVLDSDGIDYYRRLISDRNHADATLIMMAQWSLEGLQKALSTITADTLFLVGANDRTVPPRVSQQAAADMPNAQVTELPELGHLLHEEDPQKVAALIRAFLAD